MCGNVYSVSDKFIQVILTEQTNWLASIFLLHCHRLVWDLFAGLLISLSLLVAHWIKECFSKCCEAPTNIMSNWSVSHPPSESGTLSPIPTALLVIKILRYICGATGGCSWLIVRKVTLGVHWSVHVMAPKLFYICSKTVRHISHFTLLNYQMRCKPHPWFAALPLKHNSGTIDEF